MRSYRDLRVWKRAHALVRELFRLTAELPFEARQIVGDELRASSVHVPAHIAAASKSLTPGDYASALNRAEAALARTEYFLVLGLDVDYLPLELSHALLAEIHAIDGALAALRARLGGGPDERATRPYRVGMGIVSAPME